MHPTSQTHTAETHKHTNNQQPRKKKGPHRVRAAILRSVWTGWTPSLPQSHAGDHQRIPRAPPWRGGREEFSVFFARLSVCAFYPSSSSSNQSFLCCMCGRKRKTFFFFLVLSIHREKRGRSRFTRMMSYILGPTKSPRNGGISCS